MNADNAKAQMRKGVLELCLLSLLARGEMYPSELIARLREAELIVVEGTLYPLLNRLKDAGMLEYEWRESNAGPPRKYYRITETGRLAQEAMGQAWLELVRAVSHTLTDSNTPHE